MNLGQALGTYVPASSCPWCSLEAVAHHVLLLLPTEGISVPPRGPWAWGLMLLTHCALCWEGQSLLPRQTHCTVSLSAHIASSEKLPNVPTRCDGVSCHPPTTHAPI